MLIFDDLLFKYDDASVVLIYNITCTIIYENYGIVLICNITCIIIYEKYSIVVICDFTYIFKYDSASVVVICNITQSTVNYHENRVLCTYVIAVKYVLHA